VAYNTQNREVCELCPSCGILNTGKTDVSVTGSVFEMLCFSVFRIPDGD
jgi:hypothetical protein